ncbi:hypothetical protein C4573_02820 [Candidatus Woesearchaeota archaeon]|nr:MAG: hypothetical protein C4573_02820 [Candidatus Woesearchaeota archaeon]
MLDDVVKKSVVLFAPLELPDATPSFFKDAFDDCLRTYDMLSENGYTVKILGPEEENVLSRKMWRYISALETARSGSVLRLPLDHCFELAEIRWPRDTFQFYGDVLCIAPRGKKITKKIFDALGIPLPEHTVRSSLGEGGMAISAGNALFISEGVQNAKILQVLSARYDIHVLPTPTQFDHRHIDTAISFIPAEKPLLLIDPDYAFEHVEAMIDLVYRLHSESFIVPMPSPDYELLAVNMLVLPDGKVLLPEVCRETRSFLQKHLPKERILTCGSDFPNYGKRGLAGGIRCMSNIVYNLY